MKENHSDILGSVQLMLKKNYIRVFNEKKSIIDYKIIELEISRRIRIHFLLIIYSILYFLIVNFVKSRLSLSLSIS